MIDKEDYTAGKIFISFWSISKPVLVYVIQVEEAMWISMSGHHCFHLNFHTSCGYPCLKIHDQITIREYLYECQ